MTAKVLDFNKARQRTLVEPPIQKTTEKSSIDVFHEVYQKTQDAWQYNAFRNKLNVFIESQIPKIVFTPKGGDYLNDLNLLSEIERKLGMNVVVFCPGSTKENVYGWLAGFHRDEDVFSTPPDMATEANARAFNILLFIALETQFRKLSKDKSS